MAGQIEARLKEKGIELPAVSKPQGSYVPYIISGNLVFLSGQLPMADGEIKVKGKLGQDVSLEEGQKAARLCGLNLIAQVREACGGDLDRVKRVVKLGGFVNATPDYTDQPKVVNGCSDLMAEVFGDRGQHARAAVGVGSLPLNVAVEIEGIFEIE
ncbi:RidA family protein [Ferruginivarius sediminum]|uniref:RidA family protein n=1 Tax=Ferruginivarius sediminum TaxID=2661937 RepID=A0A369TC32_9PROT|nr:RidA family protein [Ferruginivarius sediminum]RDD62840.1 RidA family protein [Ferruginivarius sediminum]